MVDMRAMSAKPVGFQHANFKSLRQPKNALGVPIGHNQKIYLSPNYAFRCYLPSSLLAQRAGRLQAETGLPRGTNLVIAPTKDAAEVWSNKLGAGGGLSVLNYVMPLKERRLLSAKQVAAFQVVVTTYDVRVILAVSG